ncbi:MAG: RNA polymerase sigma factor [Planctomycetes bacterium]|nr:RNA polymerase sigma factor [Planctomycetota bacterium]MCW8136198.1 RNA polymerase sigma factor [Planctomycetota bacterium]
MPESQPETAALVGKARNGDRDAFAALMERYQEGVFGQMIARCGDPGRAQEVTQDAFVTAFTTLGRLEKPESFRSWVIGIGINLLRRRKKEIANLELLQGAHAPHKEALTAMAGAEQVNAVRQAIEDLPENYRTALMMHYFDKQRGKAIGQELGVSEGAVHMILLRARKALAEKLKDFDPGND